MYNKLLPSDWSKYATKTQIKVLFKRMYTNDLPRMTSATTAASFQGAAVNSVGRNSSAEKLSQTAREFVEKIPDDMFSLAEIQGFLLKRKKGLRGVEGRQSLGCVCAVISDRASL